MNYRLLLIVPAAGMGLMQLLCNIAPVAGPSTEEGNPQVVAVVVDSLKNPVPGISVSAFRLPSGNDSLQVPTVATTAATGVTDNSGRCEFDSLAPGTYSFEASNQTASLRALGSSISFSADEKKSFTDTLMLSRPGSFKGVVSRGGVPGVVASQNTNLVDGAIMVIIQEIGLSAITPPSGAYSFPSLPPGAYTVIYYATDGFFSAKRTVIIDAGEALTGDTVILKPVPRLLPPKGCTVSYGKTDTSSDTGPVRIEWQPVDFDSLRWYEVERFDLAGPFDTVLITTDTFVIDDVAAIPAGTILNYVVRSVDRAFNKSANAGPYEVVVK